MKQLLIAGLTMLSFSAEARIVKYTYCPKILNQIPTHNGFELVSLDEEAKEKNSSRLVCNLNGAGPYLSDNSSQRAYKFFAHAECYRTLYSIIDNVDNSYTFTVDEIRGFILAVKRNPNSNCNAKPQ